MSVSPTVLLVCVAIGMPLLLLALGVLYHAWVLRQQQTALPPLEAHVAAAATGSNDELVEELHRAMRDVQGQLSRQRESLGSLLSDAARPPRREPALATVPTMPAAPPAPAPSDVLPPHLERGLAATEAMTSPSDLRASVRQLAAEGLSDRAIARRLHVGLEEVRLARARVGSIS